MYKQIWAIALCAIGCMGSASAQKSSAPAAEAQSQDGTFVIRLDLETAADGSVSKVAAVGEFPDAVKQVIEKRVATWRFAPAVWQGKPVGSRFNRFLRLQLVPTTTGGFAMRSQGYAYNYFAKEYPMPPTQFQWNAFRSHVVFAYRVAVTAQGQITDVAPLLPEKHESQQSKQYSRNVAEWLPNWRVRPFETDGVPVACQRIYVMEHSPDRIGTRISQDVRGWADEADLGKLPADDAQRIEQALANLQDRCPAPVLVTNIENTLL